MEDKLQKILGFIERTGSSCLVVDSQKDKLYVVTDLVEYEKNHRESNQKQNIDWKNLTEEELLDRVSKEIALWRENREATNTNSGGV